VLGGIEALPPKKVTNDLVDVDYIVLGTLSCELHSKENRVKELYQNMGHVMDARWKWVCTLYDGATDR
jgi:hypothetical protein